MIQGQTKQERILNLMAHNNQNAPYQKFVQLLIGIALLTLGITLILVWRHDVVSLFRGVIGMTLALAGLLILYGLNKK